MRDLDALRRFLADPAPPTDDALARAEARLRGEIDGTRPRRRRRRRFALALIPVALVVAGAGYALHEPARVDAGIACGDEPKIWPRTLLIMPPNAGDPVAACTRHWRKGDVGAGTPVPELTACVAPTGAVVVLPGRGRGFCQRAGGTDIPPGYRERRKRFAKLFTALQSQFSAGNGKRVNPDFQCVGDAARAAALVRQTLDAHGFRDWRVALSEERFGPDRPCASLAYDERGKTIMIVPV